MRRQTNRWGFIPAAALGFMTFVVLIPFARLDFDPHHDGYMLGVAIAIHDGLRAHADVFAQYGPVTPWLQGWALHLPFGPALDLRLMNALFIALGVFLLADAGRTTPRGWPISRATGWWAAAAWLLLADVWLRVPMLPWSSTIGAVETILIINLVARGLRRRDEGSLGWARIDFAFAAALLPALLFTRLNVAIVVIAGLGLLLVVAAVPWIGRNRALASSALLGLVISGTVLSLILAAQQSWPSYVDQAILYPFGHHAGQQTSSDLLMGLVTTLAWQLPAIAVMAAALLLQRRLRGFAPRVACGLAAGALVVAFENRRIVTDPVIQGWVGRLLTPNEVFLTGTQPNFQYLYLAMALVLTSGLAILVAACAHLLRERRMPEWILRWGLITVVGIAGLVQTVPTWDPRHIWWGLPAGLLLVFAVIRTASPRSEGFANPLMLPMIALAVMAVFSGWNYLRVERVDGPSGSLVENMRLNVDLAKALAEDRAFLSAHISPQEPALYLLQDGAYAVLDNRFTSIDPYFVGWGRVPELKERVTGDPPIVLQRGWAQDTWQGAIDAIGGYRLVDSNLDLLILQRSPS